MSNVFIASNDSRCQPVASALQESGFLRLAVSQLGDQDTLVLVAHDSEIGDGYHLVHFLQTLSFPQTAFQVVLIICSPSKLAFGAGLYVPAENLAKYFKRKVLTSTDMVYGVWNDRLAGFSGEFITITP